jgi:hypothetical protein
VAFQCKIDSVKTVSTLLSAIFSSKRDQHAFFTANDTGTSCLVRHHRLLRHARCGSTPSALAWFVAGRMPAASCLNASGVW